MTDWTRKKYWLVGASEGLGRALAHRLSAVGCELVLSARSEDRLEELAAELPGRASVLPFGVDDRAATEAAAARLAEEGLPDGLVHLAGVYWPMKAAEWDAEKVETMCDVNFTGTARVVGAVLPQMLKRGTGHIVLTGSLSGYRGLAGAMGYGASKAGVMYLAEALHAELRTTGIKVQLANPGFVRTRLTDKNAFDMPFLMEPEQAARHIFELMNSDAFSRSFPGGFASMFRAANFLPDWLYYRTLGRN